VPVPSGAATGGILVYVGGANSEAWQFYVTTNESLYFYFSDALGSTRVVAGSDGTVCYDADLYPYGGLRAYNSSCAPNQVFTGQERDSETGNDYYGARYYSSQFGRFISPDPAALAAADISNPQSWNAYAYVKNNPASRVDPFGLDDDSPTDFSVILSFWSPTDLGGDFSPFGPFGIPAVQQPIYLCVPSCTLAVNQNPFGNPFNQDHLQAQTYSGPSNAWYNPNPGTPRPLYVPTSPFAPPTGSPQGPAQTKQSSGCLQSIFNPTCKKPKKPSCPSVFAHSSWDAMDTLDLPLLPPGYTPEDLAKTGAIAWAAQHSVDFGLVVPLRSGTIQTILLTGELVSTALATGPAIYSEGVGLWNEFKQWESGGCSTIWSE